MSTAAPIPYVDDTSTAAPASPSGTPYADPTPQQPAAPTPQQQPDAPQQQPQQPVAPQGPTSEQAASQQPGSNQPVVITPVKRGGILGVMDDIAHALTGGSTRPEFATDPTGNKYVKETTLSRGEQWRKITGELLQGAASGLAAGQGAGNMGKAPLAGFQAQQQQQQREDAQRQNMTAEARQENLDRGNRVMQNMQMTKMSWELTNAQHDASENDVKYFTGQKNDLIKMGGKVVGTAAHPGDIAGILKESPDAVQAMIQHGTLVPVQSFDEDGKRNGTTFLRMPDDYATKLLPVGTNIPVWNAQSHQIEYQKSSDPIDAAHWQVMSQGAGLQAQQWATAQHTQKIQDDKDKSTMNLQSAEATDARARAGLASAQAKALNTASSSADIQNNARQLFDGTADPANLSKRSKSYDATIAAANAISMSETGQPFDLAKAAGDYKFATQKGTTDTLNYLNSLVGHDNSGGNLGAVVNLSNNFKRSQFPALNDVAGWAKISAGNSQVAAYRTALVETSDQIAKILQGGSGGGTSDAKMRQAQELLDKGSNAEQIGAVAGTLRTLLGNRKTEMIGTNRYLNRWYVTKPAAPAAAAAAPAPPAIGAVQGGYKFKGGDPAVPANWEPIAPKVTP